MWKQLTQRTLAKAAAQYEQRRARLWAGAPQLEQ
jgi:hypothetical protein